ncbi:MAG TPA: DNA polymerase [Rubrobacteraceae bacterium]|nr:DNA polymerase [Rubrobacteraceae bacterium]
MSPHKVSHKLTDVARRELGEVLDKKQQKADWGGELTDEMLPYAAKDTEVLPPLQEKLAAKVEDADLKRVIEIEHRALPAMVWMANAGVPFDVEGWRRHLERVEEEKNHLVLELKKQAPDHPEGKEWNWNSWQQILKAFGLLGVTLPDTKEETLSRCDHPLARTLLEYRKASKVLGTYGPSLLEKVEENDRIYPSWRQVGAGTGRMACSSPNLQNLLPEARKHVEVPEGRALAKADYSQIELRIAAKISGDERMLGAFAAGQDIHTITARSITGKEQVSKEDRKLAKAINFGLLYGMGPAGLRHYARGSYGVEMTAGEAERYWRGFFEAYPGLKAWHDREYRELKKGSTETRTLTGRRRTGVTKLTERLNSPVQGTGADGLKLALALLYERRHECPGVVPILVVHDEIVIECDEKDVQKSEAWLKKAMVDGMDQVLNVPDLKGPRVPVEVEAKTGRTWVE